MSDDTDIQPSTRIAGQVIFVGAALALSALLLMQIGQQTTWAEDEVFAAQPRFWPAMSLAVMVAGFGLHLWRMKRRRPNRFDREEMMRWVQPLEFMIWFMVFVFAVPIVGFLPMSLAFSLALTWRLGYRRPSMLVAAAVFAVAVVIVFKGFLGVRIPGAALYEALPAGPRSFFLQYL